MYLDCNIFLAAFQNFLIVYLKNFQKHLDNLLDTNYNIFVSNKDTKIIKTRGGMIMNEINICDTELQIKEYRNQRVVTFRDIDAVHQRPQGTARKRFNDNKKRFIEGSDFFKAKCSEVRPFFGQPLPNGYNPKADIILVTETGYLMLVKSFSDDLAWAVQRELVNAYFRPKQECRHIPTRPLTSDDYMEAAQTVRGCPLDRLDIVLGFYEIAGLEIPKVQEKVEVQKKAKEKNEARATDAQWTQVREILGNYSLREAAAKTNIPFGSLGSYRNGKRKPTEERCNIIINMLG